MKKNLPLVLIIISTFIFGQNPSDKIFTFDHLLHYQKVTEKGQEDKMIFVSSQDSEYQMVVTMVDGRYFGDLVSHSDGKSYFFNVDKNERTPSNFDFTYFGESKLENIFSKKYTWKDKEYHRFIKIDDKSLELKFYKDKKMKREICTHYLEISKSDFPLFSAYRSAFLSFFERDDLNLSNQENFMVHRSEIKYGKGNYRILLKEFKTVIISIKIPST